MVKKKKNNNNEQNIPDEHVRSSTHESSKHGRYKLIMDLIRQINYVTATQL